VKPTPQAAFLTRLRELAAGETIALVTVTQTKGSAPREAGTMMAVRADGSFLGTIGGGALEWEAQAIAREAIAEAVRTGRPISRAIDRALGPDLGQCCGGRVLLEVVTLGAGQTGWLDARITDAGRHDDRQPLLLFGAGHVGRALTLALAPLPFRVTWVDDRDEAFPAHVPANVEVMATRDPIAEVSRAAPGAMVLILTHDHALDLAITAAALKRDDLPHVGLIGSATKRARFERRLGELGVAAPRIASLICPIGLPGIEGKEPAVIAASVAAQLLADAEMLRAENAVATRAAAAP
jgi:xanthine dehydrogenase accessory factor